MKANVDIIIAGGGLGGLFAAICLVQQGMNVTVLERTKEYKPLGGPIQLASNGMGVAHAISDELAKNIRAASRPFWSTKSGIRDGITSEWMFTFDAITQIPCEDSLPFSICIDRSDLQSVLLEELNRVSTDREVVRMGTAVSRYFESDKGVEVFLENGETLSCDILIGADGIWSTVRSQMFDEVSSTVNDRFAIASYTGFKLYSGLPISNSSDYFDLGYSAFIGPDHYFVVCPDRFGRVQWYAFVKALPRTPTSTPSKKTLTNTFKDWAPEVRNLIAATDEGGIIQRDLLDRTPSIRKSWAKGNVVLLGDSCHATMPNIGQGTGLAFEDGYMLAQMLSKLNSRSEISEILQRFYRRRIVRTAVVQGLGRLNSEAIKLLTPLLPVRPVVDFILSPLLPAVFYLQFKYCYSFCPFRMDVHESRRYAEEMKSRHMVETLNALTRVNDSL
jgi:zeaxanthin epoxidase